MKPSFIVLAVLAAVAQAGTAEEKGKENLLTGKDVTEEKLTDALAPKPAGEMRLRTLSVGAAAGPAAGAASTPAAASAAAGSAAEGKSAAGASTAGAPTAGASSAGASAAGASTAGASTTGASTTGAATAGAATAGAATAGAPAAGPAAAAAAAAPAAVAVRSSASLLITFRINSSDLTDPSREQLDVLARALKGDKLKGLSFTLEGHADPRGNPQSNLTLSQARAESVRSYLMKHHGIEAARLQAVGKGDRELMNKNDPAAPENRRVTIVTQ
ncbi:MAG TPA: OmpA family protein [Burkholderiaceae bacterium]|nr:OmpA family protein [Burkholderiaceae bacterium]